MNALVSFGLCTLSDEELIKKVDQMTDSLYDPSKGQKSILSRHIPARPDEDYDLLVGELCKRFYNKIK